MIGILGGTFDPIHNGHLHIAQNVLKQVPLSEIQFIPTNIPPHREQPIASSQDRLKMVELATKGHSHFKVNPIEINRDGPSYSIDTVKALENKQQSISLILGCDVFLTFDKWKQWQQITDHCHLIIVNRPGFKLSQNSKLHNWYQQHHANSIEQLQSSHHGKVILIEIPPTQVSATHIRKAITAHQDVSELLPQNVLDYIKSNHIYTQAT